MRYKVKFELWGFSDGKQPGSQNVFLFKKGKVLKRGCWYKGKEVNILSEKRSKKVLKNISFDLK